MKKKNKKNPKTINDFCEEDKKKIQEMFERIRIRNKYEFLSSSLTQKKRQTGTLREKNKRLDGRGYAS